MAYRKIHDDFWTDPDMEDLTPEQKYFYLYLITNPNVNQIGLYEFSLKRACFELGYNMDTVSKLLDTFEKMGKIKKSKQSKEILVVKFYWHNKSGSPKLKKHVSTLLDQVKDRVLIQYIYGMDTASQEEEEKDQRASAGFPPPSFSDDQVDIPTYDDFQKYFETKGFHNDYLKHLYESHLGLGWVTKSNGIPIRDWKHYFSTFLRYQRNWITEQATQTSENYVPSYHQYLD